MQVKEELATGFDDWGGRGRLVRRFVDGWVEGWGDREEGGCLKAFNTIMKALVETSLRIKQSSISRTLLLSNHTTEHCNCPSQRPKQKTEAKK